MLDRVFHLKAARTTISREVLAGITTFLTMAYIVFVNPAILSKAGMDFGSVFVATCLAAAIGTMIMALVANYPVALAPGMGLNAYFTFTVVPAMNGDWRTALGCVFISGLMFLALSLSPARQWMINAIPKNLKAGIAAGIGLFLGLIGLKNAGIVIDHPATLVGLGSLAKSTTLLACAGFIVIAALSAMRVMGAIIIGILGVTLAAVLLGYQKFAGIMDMPPSMAPTLLQMDIVGALNIGLVTVIFTFLLVDLLDTAGTLIAVGEQGNLTDKRGRLPRLRQALTADSTATVAGAALGTSTTTSFIESASGIEAGGRTGLTAFTVALLFLGALFFAPLAKSIPAYATAPALVFVACLMVKSLAKANWTDMTEYVPMIVTAIMMPFTFSIATGIGLGFITYVALKLLTGKFKQLNFAVILIAALFAAKVAFT